MNREIIEKFGNRVRLRACGLCWNEDKLLMVNHKSLTASNFWAPPGGGVEFGQSLADCLKSEFEQETGLEVNPGGFLFGCEFINGPLHAIELFYEVSVTGGELKTGYDPELGANKQIISSVAFLSESEIAAIPQEQKHGIFKHCQKTKELCKLSGFYII
jgi:8-oxo-dGTP diphosphatase